MDSCMGGLNPYTQTWLSTSVQDSLLLVAHRYSLLFPTEQNVGKHKLILVHKMRRYEINTITFCRYYDRLTLFTFILTQWIQPLQIYFWGNGEKHVRAAFSKQTQT